VPHREGEGEVYCCRRKAKQIVKLAGLLYVSERVPIFMPHWGKTQSPLERRRRGEQEKSYHSKLQKRDFLKTPPHISGGGLTRKSAFMQRKKKGKGGERS